MGTIRPVSWCGHSPCCPSLDDPRVTVEKRRHTAVDKDPACPSYGCSFMGI